MTASGSAEFTLNLISNASLETFPGNKLSSFTTLLPTPVTLSGHWQVALLEISWPAMVRNITDGQITVSKIVPRPKSPPPHQSPSKNIPSRRPGVVSMRVSLQFRAVKPALTFTAPEVRYIKLGCYSSIDDIMEAIVKSATRNAKKNYSRQQLSTIQMQHGDQQIFRGRLIRRRKNFTLSFGGMWSKRVWLSEQNHRI